MTNCFIQKWSHKTREDNKIKRIEQLILAYDELDGYTVSCIVNTQSNMTSRFTQYFVKERDAQNMFDYLKKFEVKDESTKA